MRQGPKWINPFLYLSISSCPRRPPAQQQTLGLALLSPPLSSPQSLQRLKSMSSGKAHLRLCSVLPRTQARTLCLLTIGRKMLSLSLSLPLSLSPPPPTKQPFSTGRTRLSKQSRLLCISYYSPPTSTSLFTPKLDNVIPRATEGLVGGKQYKK